MNLLILLVIIPLFGAILNVVIGKSSKKARQVVSTASTLILIILAAKVLQTTLKGNIITYEIGNWKPPIGINLVADSLSALMVGLISCIGFLCVIYSISYMRRYKGVQTYDSLLMFIIAGMIGTVLTGDLFNMFVFLEITFISAYPLVGFFGGAREMEASFKYMVLSTIASLMFLLGIGLIYNFTGTLNMAHIAEVTGAGEGLLDFALILLMIGLGLVSAIVPLHAWLPDAHPAAPTPISALLSGVTVKVGLYGMLRIVYTMFGFQRVPIGSILLVLGLATIIIGAGFALVQTDIKRMLAYSTISQVGYIALALGIGTQSGVEGAVFHILNHALMKSLLFLTVGCVIYKIGTRDMSKMGGLLKQMPLEAAAFLVGGLAIAGVPPLNGFFSKLLIYLACLEAGYLVPLAIAISVSLLTLAYYLRAFWMIFLGKNSLNLKNERVPLSMLIPVLVLAFACLVIGIVPEIGLSMTENIAEQMLMRWVYIEKVLGGAIV